MGRAVEDTALNTLFREARSHTKWQPRPVTDETVRPLNVEKTMTAPVTVIVAYDLKFYEQLPKLFPHNAGMAKLFESNPEMVETTAKRNSSLQGAYLIMAARALGLDCGPM